MAFDGITNASIEVEGGLGERLNSTATTITITTGSAKTIYVKPKTHYVVPTTVTVTNATGADTYEKATDLTSASLTLTASGTGNITITGAAVAKTYTVTCATNSIYTAVTGPTVGNINTSSATYTIKKVSSAGYLYPSAVTAAGANVSFTAGSSVFYLSNLSQNITVNFTTGKLGRALTYSAAGGMSYKSGTANGTTVYVGDTTISTVFANAAHYGTPVMSNVAGLKTPVAWSYSDGIATVNCVPDDTDATPTYTLTSSIAEYPFEIVNDGSTYHNKWEPYGSTTEIPDYILADGTEYTFLVSAYEGYKLDDIQVANATRTLNYIYWTNGVTTDVKSIVVTIKSPTGSTTAKATNVQARTWTIYNDITNGNVSTS